VIASLPPASGVGYNNSKEHFPEPLLPAGDPLVDSAETSNRLSRINTQWTLVFEANKGEANDAQVAQQELIQRYCGAIYRYLLAAVRDADAADDLSQEFALRLVRGDFRRADPNQGRFRDFLKTTLYHLIVDHQRRKVRRHHEALAHDVADTSDESVELPSDQEFIARWREELLNRAWDSMAILEKQSGQPFYTILRFRAENPEARSGEIAQRLSGQLNKPLTDVGVRQTLHRAREKFADLLLEEVARSLETRAVDRLEQELIDLDLLAYCRTALGRFSEA
jgi:RNA polymerase sigma-70 factor (ECF subfamily)